MVKLFIKRGSINDATGYYINIIEEVFKDRGENIKHIYDCNTVDSKDIIIVISAKDFFRVWYKHPYKIICWFQGIEPEENSLYTTNWWRKHIYVPIFSYIEAFALKHADLSFFVSQKMLEHYKHKYNYHSKNYVIMPCFNQEIQTESFSDVKYNNPSFVYTGSLSGWQCFEETISLFSKIKQKIPSATLSIYTEEKEKAKIILRKYHVDADIKYVSSTTISKELSKYKYGFLIRKDNIVNNVATPTKMNTYLSNGVIPIYTDVIQAFKEPFKDKEYIIKLDILNNGLDYLYTLENRKIKAEKIYIEYKKIFSTFYSKEFYKLKISHSLDSIL